MNAESGEGLERRVLEWLNKEGYPLEFWTAQQFLRNGIPVRQGQYVQGADDGAPREIDVVAYLQNRGSGPVIRVQHAIECKWSMDKPWIVFTSKMGRMAPSAAVAQTICSMYGQAALWAVAGREDLARLSMYKSVERPGYDGRRAFSSGRDLVYDTLRSVVSKARLLAQRHDRPSRKQGELPDTLEVVFPLVVLEGELFEAHYDTEADAVAIEPADYVRIHWKGSEEWAYFATVEVVRKSHLPAFVAARRAEFVELLLLLEAMSEMIGEAFETLNPIRIPVFHGSRGILGAPRLLRELNAMASGEILPPKERRRLGGAGGTSTV